MKNARSLATVALAAGTAASLASLFALMVHSQRSRHTPWQMINAPSHWVHGQEALRQRQLSGQHTLLGFAIHHLSSLWWAAVYTRICPCPAGQAQPSMARAAVVALGAWVVDTWLVPRRLTPGFERQATPAGLLVIYGSFGAGLWLGHLCHAQTEAGPAERCSARRASAGPGPCRAAASTGAVRGSGSRAAAGSTSASSAGAPSGSR